MTVRYARRAKWALVAHFARLTRTDWVILATMPVVLSCSLVAAVFALVSL